MAGTNEKIEIRLYFTPEPGEKLMHSCPACMFNQIELFKQMIGNRIRIEKVKTGSPEEELFNVYLGKP